MKRRIIAFSLLALLLIAWLGWSYALPHTTLSEGPMDYAEAQGHSPIHLPPSATNIRVATYRHWTETTTYIRFEAPLEDCRALAHELLGPGVGPDTIRIASTQAADLPPPSSSKHFSVKELEWFDANHVTNGERYAVSGGQTTVVISIPPATQATQASPIFYYRDGD